MAALQQVQLSSRDVTDCHADVARDFFSLLLLKISSSTSSNRTSKARLQQHQENG